MFWSWFSLTLDWIYVRNRIRQVDRGEVTCLLFYLSLQSRLVHGTTFFPAYRTTRRASCGINVTVVIKAAPSSTCCWAEPPGGSLRTSRRSTPSWRAGPSIFLRRPSSCSATGAFTWDPPDPWRSFSPQLGRSSVSRPDSLIRWCGGLQSASSSRYRTRSWSCFCHSWCRCEHWTSTDRQLLHVVLFLTAARWSSSGCAGSEEWMGVKGAAGDDAAGEVAEEHTDRPATLLVSNGFSAQWSEVISHPVLT